MQTVLQNIFQHYPDSFDYALCSRVDGDGDKAHDDSSDGENGGNCQNAGPRMLMKHLNAVSHLFAVFLHINMVEYY